MVASEIGDSAVVLAWPVRAESHPDRLDVRVRLRVSLFGPRVPSPRPESQQVNVNL